MAEPGKTQGLDELNRLLGRGWRVATVTSMGGAGKGDHKESMCFAALVVVENGGEAATELLEHFEQPEELPEETGDGSHLDIGEGGR